jgi:gliding motility-associated-like protein
VEGAEIASEAEMTVSPNKTTTYHFTATANECFSASGAVTITVEEPITFDLKESDLMICEGTSVVFEPINLKGTLSESPYKWMKNGSVLATTAQMTDVPTEDAVYELVVSGNRCSEARKSVSVTVEKQPSVSLSLSDDAVCEGSEVTLTATQTNVLGLEWMSRTVGKSGFGLFANGTEKTQTVVPTRSVDYRVRTTGNQVCPAATSDIVTLVVEPKLEITLPTEVTICPKESKVVEAKFSQEPTKIAWMMRNENAANFHPTSYTQPTIEVSPNVTSVYKVVASSANCPNVEAEVVVNVDVVPNWTLTSDQKQICEGDAVTVTADLPKDYKFVWEVKRDGETSYEKLPETEAELVDGPNKNATYRLTAYSPAGCPAGEKSLSVKVDKAIDGLLEDLIICDGDTGIMRALVEDNPSYKYYWSDTYDFSNIISKQKSVRVAPKFATPYYLKIENGKCLAEFEADVEVRTLPEVVGVEDYGNRMYRVIVEGGTEPYTYKWGKGSMPTSSDVLQRAIYGFTYDISVTDDIGCKTSDTITIPTYEIEIPKSFNPEIEDWVVKNLDRFVGTQVTIYDRWGKVLQKYPVDEFKGWDGTYNGHDMPSTDYWYVISVGEQDREYVGHVTLLRFKR